MLQKFLQASSQEFIHQKLGLERIREILKALHHPEQSYSSVLVAGTNGKGSTICLVEAVLVEAGYGVGAYSSPHLQRFTERIRVGGKEVEEEFLDLVLQGLLKQGLLKESGEIFTQSGDRLTWFEKATVLAFEVFKRKNVPLALLEVGLGARLDATNVVEPLVSAVTSISRDHVQVLGDSLFEIAKEKLAVARPGRPFVLGPMDLNVRVFLMESARMLAAKPVMPKLAEGTLKSFSYGPFQNLKLKMQGDYILKNAVTALEILIALKGQGFKISNEAVHQGFAKAFLPGRMELIKGEPSILLEAAHNEEGLKELLAYLKKQGSLEDKTLVLGFSQKKELKELLGLFKNWPGFLILTEFDSPRSASLDELKKWAAFHQLKAEVFSDSKEALNRAKDVTPKKGLVVVSGSLYWVGEVRGFLS